MNLYVIYDPGAQAYREVDAATAKQYVQAAEDAKKQLIENGDW